VSAVVVVVIVSLWNLFSKSVPTVLEKFLGLGSHSDAISHGQLALTVSRVERKREPVVLIISLLIVLNMGH
jgi:hypothetical protein